MNISELYSDLKVKHEEVKRLNSFLRKENAKLNNDIKILREQLQIDGVAPDGYVKAKTHRKLQKRFAELNTYVRNLESKVIKEKEIKL